MEQDLRSPEQKAQEQLALRQAVNRLMEHMHQKAQSRQRKEALLKQALFPDTSTPSPNGSTR
jgi:hypothetical protein